jgi:hypothetical protein
MVKHNKKINNNNNLRMKGIYCNTCVRVTQGSPYFKRFYENIKLFGCVTNI